MAMIKTSAGTRKSTDSGRTDQSFGYAFERCFEGSYPRNFDGTVILVSHDRDFLDGLATKVYEFGGGLVKEHLGGIYESCKRKR